MSSRPRPSRCSERGTLTETAYAAAVGPAYQTYLTATSDAARLRRVNEANVTSAFEQLWASDFAAALGTFALTHPSPWATFAVAKANAEAVRVGSIAPARATTESGLAQADHDFLTGLAGELATWLVASTDREQWQSLSEAEARLGAVLASADDLFASSGGTITGASLASTPSGSGVPSGFGSVWMSGPYSGSSTIGGTWTGSSSLLTTPFTPSMLVAPYTPSADSSALPNNFVENLFGSSAPRSEMNRGHTSPSELNTLSFNGPNNAVYGDDDTPNPAPLPRDYEMWLGQTPLRFTTLKTGQTANEATGKVPEQVDEVLRIPGGAGDDVIAGHSNSSPQLELPGDGNTGATVPGPFGVQLSEKAAAFATANPEVWAKFVELYGVQGIQRLEQVLGWNWTVGGGDLWKAFEIDAWTRRVTFDTTTGAFWTNPASVDQQARNLWAALNAAGIAPSKYQRSTLTPGDLNTQSGQPGNVGLSQAMGGKNQLLNEIKEEAAMSAVGGVFGRAARGLDDANDARRAWAARRTWPKHHPFPKYLGGAIDQTLTKIPRKLHEQFHSALDRWKGGSSGFLGVGV